jgi:hypothetical protein
MWKAKDRGIGGGVSATQQAEERLRRSEERWTTEFRREREIYVRLCSVASASDCQRDLRSFLQTGADLAEGNARAVCGHCGCCSVNQVHGVAWRGLAWRGVVYSSVVR